MSLRHGLIIIAMTLHSLLFHELAFIYLCSSVVSYGLIVLLPFVFNRVA